MTDTTNEALLQPEERGEDASVEEVTTSNNTADPSDKLTPDHPRFKEVLNRAKEAETKNTELEERIKQLEEDRSKTEETIGTDWTQEQLHELDLIAKGLKERKFMTVDDWEKEKKITKRGQEYDRLSSKYNGANGYPKFDPLEVEAYAKANGYADNYEAAYKDMHYDAILQTDLRSRQGGNNPPRSERPTGGEVIPQTELSPQDVAQMSPDEYAKVREKIHAGIKSSIKQG